MEGRVMMRVGKSGKIAQWELEAEGVRADVRFGRGGWDWDWGFGEGDVGEEDVRE
jgi:hypothetical protein